MIRTPVLVLMALCLAACGTTGLQVPEGRLAPGAGFTVDISDDWAYRSPSSDQDMFGGYVTRDGVHLNRIHFVTLDDGDALLRPVANIERPVFLAKADEAEIAGLLTESLNIAGYSNMLAGTVQSVSVDGHVGIAFEIHGQSENGLDIKGYAAAFPVADQLHLVVFLAPELHYYDALYQSVQDLIRSVDLPD